MPVAIYPADERSKSQVEEWYGKPVVHIRLERLIGTLLDHPRLSMEPGAQTSLVVSIIGKCVVETLNSIYVLEEF